MRKKRIVVIFTGGTISMAVDKELNAAIPSLSGREILSYIDDIDQIAEIIEDNYVSVPSPYMTPEMMLELAQKVDHYLTDPEIDGVIITHGTDTLEETAYFLDLYLRSPKPVILVGAMRNVSELGYDGPANLVAAIKTACANEAQNKGVMVVMNDDINAANEVMKTHTMALDTFKSLEFGPLGIVDHENVLFYRDSTHKSPHIPANFVETNVHLIKVVAGMDGTLIDYLVSQGAKGIVIEALGRGNVPPMMVDSIKHAIDKGVYVVLVSRCPKGRVSDSYGYQGGGKHLHDLGVIFGGNLSGQKARIKLMLALGYQPNKEYIQSIFEH